MKAIGFVLSIALLLSINSCSRKITEPYSESVATPVFSPQPYMYNPGQQVSIVCSTPGAEIRYTLDGSAPDKHSLLYSEPVQIDSTILIKAIAYKPKLNPSALAAGTYQIYHYNFYETLSLTQILAEPDSIDAETGSGYARIKVKVQDVNAFGVAGQRIEFYTDLGNIDASALTDSSGYAVAEIRSTGSSGMAHITAVMKKYHTEYPEFLICADTLCYDLVIHDVPPEQERHITNISASPTVIYADNGITWSNISVTVKDGNNNPVSGQSVQFFTTLGQILHSVVTNAAGMAQTTLWDDGITGMAQVTAIVRNYDIDMADELLSMDMKSVFVAILPDPNAVSIIRFVQSGTIDLNVTGVGGVEAVLLRIKLYNQEGELITGHKNVWFKILNHAVSGGAHLNDQAPSDSVMAVSNNGIAQVILNSGTTSINLIVKASCTDNGHNYVAVKDNIVIHAGPAHNIEIFAGGNNSGENLGGGLWRIVVGATCFDLHNNPVSYGTSVWFSIPDNPYNCQIGAMSYIGNESIYGDSLAGTAYTTLIYNGVYSGLPITIRAESMGYNGTVVYGTQEIILPFNNIQLELEIIPGNLVFHGNVNPVPESALATINASLFDVQGNPIHFASFFLTSTYGTFEYTQGSNSDPLYFNPIETPNIVVTGLSNYAQGLIRFYPDGIPLGDPMVGCPGVLPVTITANFIGYDESANSTISLIRYPT